MKAKIQIEDSDEIMVTATFTMKLSAWRRVSKELSGVYNGAEQIVYAVRDMTSALDRAINFEEEGKNEE